MQRFFSGVFVAVVVFGMAGGVRADEQEVKAILDKAIKALGGEAKLGKLEAYSTKSKGTITFNGSDNQIASESTVAGLDRFRNEFEGDFGGNKFKGIVVLNADKGWRRFGDNTMEMDAAAVLNEKRTVYLQVIPATIVPLRMKGFKVETAGEETVAGKPAAVLKVTGPDGKDFKLSFDKESGLPVKLQAKVQGFQGEEFTQETTYNEFADYDGIKRAKRVESKRDGEPFVKLELIEFKVIGTVDSKAFAMPE
jgi:hypothetical protein